MKRLAEGRLVLEVPDTWRVVKWDDSVAYRRSIAALADTKAVDFVAVDDRGRLLLIELKDFRDRPDGKSRVAVAFAGRSRELSCEISLKARDSLAGLWAALANGSETATALEPVAFGQVRVVFVLAESPRPSVNNGKRDAQRNAMQKELQRRLAWLTKKVAVVELDETFWRGCVVAA